LLTGFPALRIKGPYFMLLSFAWPTIAIGVTDFFPTYTGAESGIRLPGLFPFLSYSMRYTGYYFLSLTILAVVAVAAYHITHRSRIGMAFISILDDPTAAAACGVNVTKYKLMANVMSGFIATLCGCLLGHFNGNAFPSLFGMSYTFLPINYVVIGGIGTIFGAILGAYILTIIDLIVLSNLPQQYAPAKVILYSIIVIVVLWKWQGGLAKYIGKLVARLGRKGKEKASKG
jgi:branched-chain amino acid transport system permease protein